jgi:hypothetical protein
MEPTPYEIDLALAEAWAAATPGLKLRYLAQKQGWVLEADEKPATLHETAGLINPTPELVPELLAELNSLAVMNHRFKMFSLPDCARMRMEDWPAEPFQIVPDYANRHYLIYEAWRPVTPSKKFAAPPPILVRPAKSQDRLETLIQILAAQFYPEEPAHSQARQLFGKMAETANVDFLEFSLTEDNRIIGGLIVLHHHHLCYHTYGCFEKAYRGQGFLYYVMTSYQEATLRPQTQYIIGETLHITMRPGLRHLYERIGSRLKYSRSYYAKDFFRSWNPAPSPESP